MEMIVIRAPFNDLAILAEMFADKTLFHIWIWQFYLVWIVVFCMIVRRAYAAVKRFRARPAPLSCRKWRWARERQDTGEHPR